MPAGIGAAALIVRLYDLDAQSLWLDEIYTLKRATLPLTALVVDSTANHHSPLYFMLISWVLHLGTTEWMLRFPSAVFSAAAAGITGAVGRIVGGERVGVVAGALMVLSPYQLLYGQEARAYALLTCLVVIALWGLVELAAMPDRAALLPWQRDSLRGPWTAYVLGTAIALNTLNAAIPWLLAANLGCAVIAATARSARRAFLRNWLLAHLAIAMLLIPYVLIILHSLKQTVKSPSWVPPATLHFVTSAFSALYLFRVSDVVMFQLKPEPVPILGAMLIALAAWGIWNLRQRLALLAIIGFAFIIPPAMLLIVSMRQPVFLPRYLIGSAAPFFVLAAVGLAQIRFRYSALLAALLVALGGWALHDQFRYESKPRWNWAVAHIARIAQSGDVVLLPDYWTRLVFTTIADRAGLKDTGVDIVKTIDDAQSALYAGHRVWAVQGHVGFGKAPSRDEFVRSLAPLGAPSRIYDYGRNVFALFFDHPP